MESPLSFDSTENFRKKLISRNLKPFRDDGFNDGSKPGSGELVLDDESVLIVHKLKKQDLKNQINCL